MARVKQSKRDKGYAIRRRNHWCDRHRTENGRQPLESDN